MSSLHQLALVIVFVTAPASWAAANQENVAVQGEWSLNRDLTPALPNNDDDVRRPEGRRPPGGRFGGSGPGGVRRGPSDSDMRKLEAVRRRIQEVPQRLVISIEGPRVQIVDERGRATNLVADGKKQERLTGDGEFKSRTRIEGGRLIVEEDFDGPKVTTTYEPLASDGERRLQVTLKIEGMPRVRGVRDDNASRAPITRIYDAGTHAP